MKTMSRNKRIVLAILYVLAFVGVFSFVGDRIWKLIDPEGHDLYWTGVYYPPPTPVPATPAPPPEPEEFSFSQYGSRAVDTARETCPDLPVWLLHPDWRGLDYEINPTEYREVAVGEAEVTYVIFGQVYINDRLVEFAPGGIEVFQILEDKTTYELDPRPYIQRALEILDYDVYPVEITAEWRWAKDETGQFEYDYWRWEVTDVTCSR